MRKLRPLSDSLAKKAAVELNENPNDIEYYFDALRQWLLTQPHLRSRTQDQFLIVFLRGSKFSLEKAKQKIDNFYSCRNLLPELFLNRDTDDPKIYKILRQGAFLHLPRPLSDNGPRIVMIRFAKFDLKNFTPLEILKIGAIMADLCLYDDDHAIIAGYVLVMDLAEISAFQFLHFDALLTKKLIVMTNKALPSRMKGFHLINMLPAYEKCFSMVKSVINEKLRHRFYFHGSNLDSLYKHVPKDCMPIEYGGKDFTISEILEHWERKIKQHKDFFIEEEAYGCDEKLREGKPVINDSLFGIEGSFRQLNVD